MAGPRGQRGYAMAALLVGLAVMSIMLTAAMPVWRTMVTREKEEELVFRGQQYARAVGLYQRKFANAFPPSIDVLIDQRFLRKKYRDPMAKDDTGAERAFQVLYQGSMPQRPGAGGGAMGTAGRTGIPPGSIGSGGLQARDSRLAGGAAQEPATAGQGGLGTSGLGGQPVGPRGGVIGVTSTSTAKSLRVYNGRSVYNEWQFIWSPAQSGEPGASRPGMPGQPGQPPGSPRHQTPRPSFDPRTAP